MKSKQILFIKSLIFLLTYNINIALSQCTLKNIVPVQPGLTKFETRNILNSNDNFSRNVYDRMFEEGLVSNNENYVKWDYLKGDSVKRESLVYNVIYNECIKGSNSEIRFRFADDLLYQIEYTSDYSESNYNTCLSQFQLITSILDNAYLKLKVDFTHYANDNKNSKSGEGHYYTLQANGDLEKVDRKVKKISIEYVYDSMKSKYVLTYSLLNLFGTKFDVRGY